MANFIYVYNRMVHGSSGKTPYELTFSKVPNVGDLRVLYCLAYVRTLPRNRPDGKLGPRAVKGRYIGPAAYDGQPIGVRGYKILQDDKDPSSVVVCQDVYFVETQFVIDKPLPLAEPVPVTRWDLYHDDEDDSDEDKKGRKHQYGLSPPEPTENHEPEENDKEVDTPDLEVDMTNYEQSESGEEYCSLREMEESTDTDEDEVGGVE